MKDMKAGSLITIGEVDIDDDAFYRLYGFSSHPIVIQRDGQKNAVRVMSQFGEESMRVMG